MIKNEMHIMDVIVVIIIHRSPVDSPHKGQ